MQDMVKHGVNVELLNILLEVREWGKRVPELQSDLSAYPG